VKQKEGRKEGREGREGERKEGRKKREMINAWVPVQNR
jgi:hypothetical protein